MSGTERGGVGRRPTKSALKPQPVHDPVLWAALCHLSRRRSGVRRGQMFGAPALYVGSAMIACVFGDTMAFRVPARTAHEAVARLGASSFRPFGRAAMREWVCIPSHHERLDEVSRLLLDSALRFGRSRLRP